MSWLTMQSYFTELKSILEDQHSRNRIREQLGPWGQYIADLRVELQMLSQTSSATFSSAQSNNLPSAYPNHDGFEVRVGWREKCSTSWRYVDTVVTLAHVEEEDLLPLHWNLIYQIVQGITADMQQRAVGAVKGSVYHPKHGWVSKPEPDKEEPEAYIDSDLAEQIGWIVDELERSK